MILFARFQFEFSSDMPFLDEVVPETESIFVSIIELASKKQVGLRQLLIHYIKADSLNICSMISNS